MQGTFFYRINTFILRLTCQGRPSTGKRISGVRCYTYPMIEVTPDVAIDEKDITVDFIRSSGPGGQNVNKVATGVQLRFALNESASLPEDVKQRLRSIARNRITGEGVLIIEAQRFRTQEQNREDALARLAALVYQAAQKPKARKPTRPSAASQARRVEAKKRRGSVKQARRSMGADEE